MSMDEILTAVGSFDGALVVRPRPGDGSPELAWGDAFFYFAPDGRMPERTQPYGTIVTKDYPADTASRLSEPGRWRVNVHVSRAAFEELVGEPMRSLQRARDFAATDVLLPHPVYGAQGWIAVVNPAERTMGTILRLLADAHEAARARAERRSTTGGGADDA